MNRPERYATPSILLHWLVALLIVVGFGLGLTLSGMPLSPTKFKLIGWHKWLGISVLALLALRLAGRLLWPAPALPGTMSPLAQLAAKGGHLALYALMLAVPLTGWLMSSAYGIPVVYLGLLPLPDLIAANETLAHQLKEVHELLNWTLALAVAGHVLVAFKHHFIDRDGLLFRMSLKQPRA